MGQGGSLEVNTQINMGGGTSSTAEAATWDAHIPY